MKLKIYLRKGPTGKEWLGYTANLMLFSSYGTTKSELIRRICRDAYNQIYLIKNINTAIGTTINRTDMTKRLAVFRRAAPWKIITVGKVKAEVRIVKF